MVLVCVDMNMKEKMQKKRQAILDAALTVFVKNGYEKTKIIDIAQTAGIGKGTVYEYFDSKEALFRCLLDEYCQYYKESVETMMTELAGAPCREKLLVMMRMETALKEQVHLSSLDPMQLQVEFTNFPGLKQAIGEMLKYKFNAVHDILQEGVDCGEFRRMSVHLATAVLMGACSTAAGFVDSPPQPVCEVVTSLHLTDADIAEEFTDEKLLDLLLNGFCA